MQLDEFYNYKNQLMGDILTNKKIVHLLNEKIDPKDAVNLAYTQVFPYEYIPDTIEHGSSFICFDVDIQRSVSKTFYLPTLYVWVFSHSSMLRTEDGIVPDLLCMEIADMLNGSRNYGLGELDLYSVKRFAPMTDYNGKVLTFYAEDFNRISPTGKPIPSNRKKVV